MSAHVRRTNFQRLVDTRFAGSQAALATALGLTRGRVSQLLNPAQAFGERVAREIEDKLDLSTGWLDVPVDGERPERQPAESLGISPLTTVEALPIVLDALMAAPEPQREELALVLGLFLRTGATTYRKRLAELLDAAPAPWNGLERRTGTDRRAPTLPEANTGKFAA